MHRSFGGLDEPAENEEVQTSIHDKLSLTSSMNSSSSIATPDSKKSLIDSVRNNIIGSSQFFESPYGRMPCIYADWTASGRALANIESYITDQVYMITHMIELAFPWFAFTHAYLTLYLFNSLNAVHRSCLFTGTHIPALPLPVTKVPVFDTKPDKLLLSL